MVASTVAAVLAGLPLRPTLDEDYLAGYLAGMPPDDRSLWSTVRRLPAGHALVLGEERSEVRRWWRPVLGVREQARESSVLEVREAFDEAVRGRLRTRDGVSCDVSGGYDSSTVIATAVALGGDVRAVGLAFRQDPEADEVSHQQAVADHLGLPLSFLAADHLDVVDPWDFARRHGEPLYATGAADTDAIYAWAAAHGRPVSLTGVGGDEALYGEDVGVVDLAARGRLRQALTTAGRTGLAPLEAGRWIATSLARRRRSPRPSGPVHAAATPTPLWFGPVSGVWTVPIPGSTSPRPCPRSTGRTASVWTALRPAGLATTWTPHGDPRVTR